MIEMENETVMVRMERCRTERRRLEILRGGIHRAYHASPLSSASSCTRRMRHVKRVQESFAHLNESDFGEDQR